MSLEIESWLDLAAWLAAGLVISLVLISWWTDNRFLKGILEVVADIALCAIAIRYLWDGAARELFQSLRPCFQSYTVECFAEGALMNFITIPISAAVIVIVFRWLLLLRRRPSSPIRDPE